MILGEPGIGKSQFLEYIKKIFPKEVFTFGKGSSAVGLTVCVKRDQITKEWTLIGGALVLSEKDYF